MNSIFIHITKTGGVSVQQALKDDSVLCHGHATASHVIGDIGKDVWDEHFTFGFVRNPWDRMVSLYHYRKGLKRTNASKFPKFDKWVEEFVSMPNKMHKSHYHVINGNQLHWLTNSDNKLLVNFVGQFESFEVDFQKVCKVIGVDRELPHFNKSKHTHYSEYFNDHTKGLIADHFDADIDYFDYKFEAL